MQGLLKFIVGVIAGELGWRAGMGAFSFFTARNSMERLNEGRSTIINGVGAAVTAKSVGLDVTIKQKMSKYFSLFSKRFENSFGSFTSTASHVPKNDFKAAGTKGVLFASNAAKRGYRTVHSAFRTLINSGFISRMIPKGKVGKLFLGAGAIFSGAYALITKIPDLWGSAEKFDEDVAESINAHPVINQFINGDLSKLRDIVDILAPVNNTSAQANVSNTKNDKEQKGSEDSWWDFLDDGDLVVEEGDIFKTEVDTLFERDELETSGLPELKVQNNAAVKAVIGAWAEDTVEALDLSRLLRGGSISLGNVHENAKAKFNRIFAESAQAYIPLTANGRYDIRAHAAAYAAVAAEHLLQILSNHLNNDLGYVFIMDPTEGTVSYNKAFLRLIVVLQEGLNVNFQVTLPEPLRSYLEAADSYPDAGLNMGDFQRLDDLLATWLVAGNASQATYTLMNSYGQSLSAAELNYLVIKILHILPSNVSKAVIGGQKPHKIHPSFSMLAESLIDLKMQETDENQEL